MVFEIRNLFDHKPNTITLDSNTKMPINFGLNGIADIKTIELRTSDMEFGKGVLEVVIITGKDEDNMITLSDCDTDDILRVCETLYFIINKN